MTLQAWSLALLWVGALSGGLSVATTLSSALLANRVSNLATAAANIQISAANEGAKKAQLQAAEANEAAAKAQLEAANVEQQNIELREKFANRRITAAQHDALVKELKISPASFDIQTMSDSESGLYAADILKTLTDAGWKVDQKTFPLGVIWTGLIIFKTSDPAAVRLAYALKKVGIPFGIGNDTTSKVTIMVGGKPPVF